MSLKSYINTVISPDDHSIDSNFMKIVLNKICDGLDSKTSKTEVGNLSDLNTTAKTNIVAAINEAAQSGGNGGTGVLDLGLTITASQGDQQVVLTGVFTSLPSAEDMTNALAVLLTLDMSAFQQGMVANEKLAVNSAITIGSAGSYVHVGAPSDEDVPSEFLFIFNGDTLNTITANMGGDSATVNFSVEGDDAGEASI